MRGISWNITQIRVERRFSTVNPLVAIRVLPVLNRRSYPASLVDIACPQLEEILQNRLWSDCMIDFPGFRFEINFNCSARKVNTVMKAGDQNFNGQT